ncbi:MAG: hypothetical protein QX196_06050 [Methylococcaceae bacterium]
MNTTALFVELLITGIGAGVWFSLTLLCVFGYSWIPFEKIIILPALIPTIALLYVLGIIIDRISDLAFQGWDKSLRQKHFNKSTDYQRARTIVYGQSLSLRDWFKYGRSRLRICRGWTINSLLCIASLNAFIWIRLPADCPRLHLTLFSSVMFGLLSIGALSAWYSLTYREYQRLREEYSFSQESKQVDSME